MKAATKHHHSYLQKKTASKEIAKDTLIASTTKSDFSTVQAYAWHQANMKKDFVCLIKGTNPSQCGYLDGCCSLLDHRECAIECCRAADIIYTLEDGKSARCPNHHEGFKKKLNSSQVNDNNSGNSHEIDQRDDSNKDKRKEGSSEEGQNMISQKTKKEQTLM